MNSQKLIRESTMKKEAASIASMKKAVSRKLYGKAPKSFVPEAAAGGGTLGAIFGGAKGAELGASSAVRKRAKELLSEQGKKFTPETLHDEIKSNPAFLAKIVASGMRGSTGGAAIGGIGGGGAGALLGGGAAKLVHKARMGKYKAHQKSVNKKIGLGAGLAALAAAGAVASKKKKASIHDKKEALKILLGKAIHKDLPSVATAKNIGTGIGAGSGAGIGSLIGTIAAGEGKRGTGAALGALLGSGAGAGIGRKLGKAHGEFALNEAILNANDALLQKVRSGIKKGYKSTRKTMKKGSKELGKIWKENKDFAAPAALGAGAAGTYFSRDEIKHLRKK